MIKIDGSYLEGGGQIVRTALAISTIAKKPFEVYDIRKGRKEPGLKNQHLYCIKALKQLCSAVCEGDELGSTSIKYYPKKITSKNLHVDIETAGSITLLMQAVLIPSIFVSKPIKISLIGGTDVNWSMSFDYFSSVILPQVQRFAKVEAKLLRRGYYPKGGGKIEIKINPKFKLNDFDSFEEFLGKLRESVRTFDLTEQHHLIQIKGVSHASIDLQKAEVSERQTKAAKQILMQKFEVPINITAEYQDTLSTGSGITLWAIFSKNKDDIDEINPIRIGSDCLGERGKKSEDVGQECARNLIREIESGAPVDRHLSDQLVPFLALIGGKIKTSGITDHCKTNIYAVEQFFGKVFEVDEGNNIISIK
ncbi:MAG TPA: RNA 3'-terminal phosphate cyclase [Candidatus Nanoarchaeia archaeon]|nr:RNA 3'-terminal phosphate cyclase [Candidatus Nanoarchaeia archaeon]